MSKADLIFSSQNTGFGFIVLNLVTLILGFISNSTVCIVMIRSKRMPRNLSNFLVLQLSLADVILRIHVLVFTIRWIFDGFKEEFLLIFCIWNSTILMICYGVVFNLLAGIALDRFVNIVYPVKALIVEKKKIKATVLVWTYAIATSILTPFYVTLGTEKIAEVDITNERNSSNFNKTNFAVTCFIGKDITSRILFLTSQALLVIVPLIVIMFCYVKMFLALKDRDKGKSFQSIRTKSKRKVVKMLLIVVISYIVCWMPLSLFNILKSFDIFFEKAAKKRQFQMIARGFAGFSSCVNPFIYAFYNPRFRNEFLELFRGKVPRRRTITKNSNVL